MESRLTAVEFFGHDFPHPEHCTLDRNHPCWNGSQLYILSKAYSFKECELNHKDLCKLSKCKFYKDV